MSRYHICLDALRYTQHRAGGDHPLTRYCEEMLERHDPYIREHLEDMPEVRDWIWSEP